MLGWSLNLFRVRGIQLAVHFSFFLLLAFVGWEGAKSYPNPANPSELIGGGWMGVAINVAVVILFFGCVVLHEFGHSFTAMHFGVGVRRILLMPIGGMAEFDSIPRQPSRELLITIAGPAVNFAIAALLSLFVDLPPNWEPLGLTNYAESFTGIAQLLLHWNLIMGCFNLVPAFPMDGGRIFRALLATRVPYVRATFIAATVGKVFASITALLALFVWDAPLTAALFAFIFVAGEMEYRAAQRREQEEAHWRAVLARFYHAEPPAQEPPLLTR
jgi:Zn-dependent protease